MLGGFFPVIYSGACWDLALAIAWVVGGMCGNGMCQMKRGNSEENLFKNAKGRLYFLSNVIYSKSNLSRSRALVPVGNLC